MGIFDSVSEFLGDTVDDLFSSANIGSALTELGGAGDVQSKQKTNLSGLNDNIARLTTPGYKSSSSDPIASVDPNLVSRQWTERLARFAQIERETAVNLK